MQSIQHVRKTDLARSTRQVINHVLRGQVTVVESHGEPEVVIMDIVDYRIIRAEVRYYSQQPVIEVELGLPDDQAAEAMRILYTDTHNVAEPAGAIALAALLADAESGGVEQFAGRPVAVIQTGGNVDADVFAEVLEGGTPSV